MGYKCLDVVSKFQVTNFECGGYSIGRGFFGRKLPREMGRNTPQHEEIQTHIFHHSRLKNTESLPPDIIRRTQSQNHYRRCKL